MIMPVNSSLLDLLDNPSAATADLSSVHVICLPEDANCLANAGGNFLQVLEGTGSHELTGGTGNSLVMAGALIPGMLPGGLAVLTGATPLPVEPLAQDCHAPCHFAPASPDSNCGGEPCHELTAYLPPGTYVDIAG